MSKYRVSNKQNVNMNGRRTAFDLHRYVVEQDAYVFAGRYTAKGYNASDSKCAAAYEQQSQEAEDNA